MRTRSASVAWFGPCAIASRQQLIPPSKLLKLLPSWHVAVLDKLVDFWPLNGLHPLNIVGPFRSQVVHVLLFIKIADECGHVVNVVCFGTTPIRFTLLRSSANCLQSSLKNPCVELISPAQVLSPCAPHYPLGGRGSKGAPGRGVINYLQTCHQGRGVCAATSSEPACLRSAR